MNRSGTYDIPQCSCKSYKIKKKKCSATGLQASAPETCVKSQVHFSFFGEGKERRERENEVGIKWKEESFPTKSITRPFRRLDYKPHRRRLLKRYPEHGVEGGSWHYQMADSSEI
jgi:hypothetical protein